LIWITVDVVFAFVDDEEVVFFKLVLDLAVADDGGVADTIFSQLDPNLDVLRQKQGSE
jgi:hypothetical protein